MGKPNFENPTLTSERKMISRRDWWIGIVLVVLAILVHALVPRYEYQQVGSVLWIRVDRWTGQAQVAAVTGNGVQIRED